MKQVQLRNFGGTIYARTSIDELAISWLYHPEEIANSRKDLYVTTDDDLNIGEVAVLLPFVDDLHNFVAVRGYGEDYENLTGCSKAEVMEMIANWDTDYTFQIWEGRL